MNYGGAVAIQSDGKIVVVGSTHDSGQPDSFALLRYNADGSLDTGFGSGGTQTTSFGMYGGQAHGVALQSDGKIVVAGDSYQSATGDDFALARYNADGSLDTTFGTAGTTTTHVAGNDFGSSVAVQSDGKIVVAGSFYSTGGDRDFALARYNANGTLDTSFAGGGIATTEQANANNHFAAVALQSDGKIVAGGWSGDGSDDDFAVARYNTDGTLDTAFGTGGRITHPVSWDIDHGQGVAIQSDGKIVVAGYSYDAGKSRFALARYTPCGMVDAPFGMMGCTTTQLGASGDYGYSVAVQSDGKIIVAGASGTPTGSDFALARYNSDGSLDTSFGGGTVTTSVGPYGQASSVAIQSDGKIVVVGDVDPYDPDGGGFTVARYNGGDPSTPTVPPATTPISPTGTITDRQSTFSWTPVSSATWYQLWLNRDGQKYMSRWQQGTSWTPTVPLSAGDYNWAVQTWNSVGYGPWSTTANFSIARQLPGATSTTAPTGQQPIGQYRPQYSWTTATRASWYHLWVNRTGYGTYSTRWVQAPTTTWTATTDYDEGSYRWWVAAWNVDGYGPWSSGTDFSIQSMRPGAPVQLSPTGGTSVASGNVDYSWQYDSRATWYQLWVQTPDSSVSDWYAVSQIQSGGVCRASMTHTRWGNYNWWTRGWGPAGYGSWSSAAQFWCGRPYPVSGSASTLTWNDKWTTSATWYQLWLNDVTGGSTTKVGSWWVARSGTHDAGGYGRSADVVHTLSTGDYRWWVQAWGPAGGYGPWSDAHDFTVP